MALRYRASGLEQDEDFKRASRRLFSWTVGLHFRRQRLSDAACAGAACAGNSLVPQPGQKWPGFFVREECTRTPRPLIVACMSVLAFSFWSVHIEAWHIANDGHLIFNALDVGPQEWLRFQRKTIPMRQAIPGE